MQGRMAAVRHDPAPLNRALKDGPSMLTDADETIMRHRARFVKPIAAQIWRGKRSLAPNETVQLFV